MFTFSMWVASTLILGGMLASVMWLQQVWTDNGPER